MSDDDKTQPPPAGALLSDDQIRRLKVIVTIMTAVLVIGVVTLIARIFYLASGTPAPAAQAQTAAQVALLPEARLTLPQGAAVKATRVNGNRLATHYTSPRGEGVVILDLSTGKQISHVRIDAAP